MGGFSFPQEAVRLVCVRREEQTNILMNVMISLAPFHLVASLPDRTERLFHFSTCPVRVQFSPSRRHLIFLFHCVFIGPVIHGFVFCLIQDVAALKFIASGSKDSFDAIKSRAF
jgi:hypothetical protein